MVGDLSGAGIGRKQTILNEDKPTFPGESGPKSVVVQDPPMVRVTSIESLESHIKTFGELRASRLDELTSDQKADVKSRLNSLKNIEPELDSTQQSMLRTIVNHIQFALDTDGASQVFILGLAKKGLEELNNSLEISQQRKGVAPLENESPKSHSPWLAIKEFLSFLGRLVFRSEKPSLEVQKSEPEPVPVLEPKAAELLAQPAPAVEKPQPQTKAQSIENIMVEAEKEVDAQLEALLEKADNANASSEDMMAVVGFYEKIGDYSAAIDWIGQAALKGHVPAMEMLVNYSNFGDVNHKETATGVLKGLEDMLQAFIGVKSEKSEAEKVKASKSLIELATIKQDLKTLETLAKTGVTEEVQAKAKTALVRVSEWDNPTQLRNQGDEYRGVGNMEDAIPFYERAAVLGDDLSLGWLKAIAGTDSSKFRLEDIKQIYDRNQVSAEKIEEFKVLAQEALARVALAQKASAQPAAEPVSVLVQEPAAPAPQSSPEFLKGKQAIADMLNHAINTLPTDLQGVSYHEATEALYEQTY